MSDPVWYRYLNGVDDDPAILPPGYDGRQPLEDRGWMGLKEITKEAYRSLEAACQKQGLVIRMTEGFRPLRRQAYLYAQGRDLPGSIVTRALPGKGKHSFGLAFDICLRGTDPFNEVKLTMVGNVGMGQGLEWGGSWRTFKDLPHFEIKTDGR